MHYFRSLFVILVAVVILFPQMYAQHSMYTVSGSNLPPDQETDARTYGKWETVIPKAGGGAINRVLGMQTVHTVMLPSGKILMISGSSWRNLADGLQYYPVEPDPDAGTGLFIKDGDPFLNEKLKVYYPLVNNAAIYDPEENTFYRIPHPVPVDDPERPGHFVGNDLFCTGHMQLRDGDVLFAGGTQYYYPYRTGNRASYIFDWKKELGIQWQKVDWRQLPSPETNPWMFSGLMKRGRWYPSLLPLLDGRIALFGGFVGFEPGFNNGDMYMFEMNHFVEFFDTSAFDASHPQNAWKSIDVQNLPNSPFNTIINKDFKPTPETEDFCDRPCDQSDPAKCDHRCTYANQRDAFKLYPEDYLMPDGSIYMTREGDWVSLRTFDTAYMRRTKHTYWAKIGGTRQNPMISFAMGPDRPDEISSYGTTFLDPNSGNITLLGGQPTSPGTLYPLNWARPDEVPPVPTIFAGGRGSRKIEIFHASNREPHGGHWSIQDNFFGDAPQDDRTMHYALILPTRQILIINGANYDFYGAVHYPLLLTPTFKGGSFAGYKKQRMNEAVEPRLYHNTAILLPDGRVLVSGGNSTRATVRKAPIPDADPALNGQPLPDLNLVDLDKYFFGDGPQGKGEKGMLTVPTEDWVAEIFSPPYLFIDGKRRASITSIKPAVRTPHYQTEKEIGGKTFYLMHSGDRFNIQLAGMPPASQCSITNSSLNLIKLPSVTHGWDGGQKFLHVPFTRTGPEQITFTAPNATTANLPPAYYMMFYVDCKGKPSIARMVRLDNEAVEP